MPTILFADHMPRAIEHLRGADAILASLIDALPVPEPPLEEDRFRSLLSAIISQQLSGKVAATIEQRLLALYPNGPTPEAILATPTEQLREVGLSGAKARYIHDLAAQVGSDTVDLHAIDQLDDEDVIATLKQVKGIGRWTAEMFLIFALGRTDVLPAGDLGFRTALSRHYKLPALPGPAECASIGAPWRPYASIATLYLWRSYDVKT